jgi:[ribosomal protein S18]-alanine N-acetyltransferase
MTTIAPSKTSSPPEPERRSRIRPSHDALVAGGSNRMSVGVPPSVYPPAMSPSGFDLGRADSNAVIRSAQHEDLQSVVALDHAAFGSEAYPYSYFRQMMDLASDGFLVADRPGLGVVGYVLGLRAQPGAAAAWLVSLVVDTGHRQTGTGTALVRRLLDMFEDGDATPIRLYVDPTNGLAVHVYRRMGFRRVDIIRDCFGPGGDRLLMQRGDPIHTTGAPAIGQRSERNRLLLDEGQSGLAFVSILFVITSVLTSVYATSSRREFLPFAFLVVAMFGSLLASLFYANLAGELVRLNAPADRATKALSWGNALSEFVGVYPLMFAFPLVTWTLFGEVSAAAFALAVVAVSFAAYHLSGFDLLRRYRGSRAVHHLLAGLGTALMIAETVTAIRGWAVASTVLVSVTIAGCIALAAAAALGAERSVEAGGAPEVDVVHAAVRR